MAIPTLGTDQPAAPCCDTWFDFVSCVATACGEAVRNCLPDCPTFPYYVCHGEPIGPGDYLAAWLALIEPLPVASTKMALGRYRITIGVALCQDGYPMPRATAGGVEAVPSPAEHSHASLFSYGAAEAAHKAAQRLVRAGCIANVCAGLVLSGLRPEQPAFGSARWRWTVQGEWPA